MFKDALYLQHILFSWGKRTHPYQGYSFKAHLAGRLQCVLYHCDEIDKTLVFYHMICTRYAVLQIFWQLAMCNPS
jgi:hypothetical protein